MIENQKKIKKHKYNFEDRNAFPFCYAMLVLPFLSFIVFWLYINFTSIVLAFKDPMGNFTWDNFKMVFEGFVTEDMYGWNLSKILGRTLLSWVCIYVFALIPSMFSSYILYKKMPGHYVFRVIFMIPTVIGGIIWVMLMKYMVGVGGPVLTIAEKLGINIPLEVQINGLLGSKSTAYPTILIINLLPAIIGFNMIITGAYARIPESLFEVGKLEGLGFISEFIRIAFPLVMQTVIVLMLSNFAVMLTYDGNVFLYTMGHYETGTMGFYLYYLTWQLAGSASTMNAFYGYPAAIGLVLTCITIPIVLFGKLVLEKAFPPVEY